MAVTSNEQAVIGCLTGNSLSDMLLQAVMAVPVSQCLRSAKTFTTKFLHLGGKYWANVSFDLCPILALERISLPVS